MDLNNDTTNPAAEPETPEVEVEPESQVDEAEAANEGDDPDSQASEPEFDEVEIDGKTYRVPKEIAPHVMKNADYTQKTQVLAEQRREWEAAVAQERERIQFESETFETIKADEAQRVAIQGRMEALRNVNFNTLAPQDAARYNHEMMQLQWAHNELSANIEAKRGELSTTREREAANAWHQTVEALNRPDEKLGWNGKFDETSQARLADIAMKELGVPQHRLRATMSDPIAVKALNLVAIGLETLKKQKAALTAKPKVPEAKPVPTVSGSKAKGSVDPDKMPMDQWVKYERQRMAKRS
jgi:hypothetical protein